MSRAQRGLPALFVIAALVAVWWAVVAVSGSATVTASPKPVPTRRSDAPM